MGALGKRTNEMGSKEPFLLPSSTWPSTSSSHWQQPLTRFITRVSVLFLFLSGSMPVGAILTGSPKDNSACSINNKSTSDAGSRISSSKMRCPEYLREPRGHFSTPNFPGPFPVPFDCSWVIDASNYDSDSVIVLYMTQMYLTRGVHVVEYNFHNATLTKGRREKTLRYLERPFSFIKFKAKFIEVHVSLHDLSNANIRVQDRLVDVYGFNITYEIQTPPRVRHETCNTFNCSFNGHCYASANYSHFYCSCLPGFHGRSCEYGPDCDPHAEPPVNFCKNGGMCRYSYGATVIRCMCPVGFNGTACEYRRSTIPPAECYSLAGLNCSHHCVVGSPGRLQCGCPSGYAFRADNATCYKLDPRRLVVELAIATSDSSDSSRVELENQLRQLINNTSAGLLSMGAVNFISERRLASRYECRIRFHLWSSEKMVNNTAAFNRSGSSHHFRSVAPYSNAQRVLRASGHSSEDKQWPSAVSSTIKQLKSGLKPNGNSAVLNVSYEEVQTLVIESVEAKSARDGRVQEGATFTVACVTSGSEKLQVRWFKDGIPIDPEKSLREMQSTVLAPNMLGFYTASLLVKKATAADGGEYECRTSDWYQVATKSIFIEVVTRPILEVTPSAAYVQPKSSVTLTCIDDNDLARRTLTTYTWLRDKEPIRHLCNENLYPVGSLLKVFDVQNSTVFTCRATSQGGTIERSATITVVEKGFCPQEKFMSVQWLSTSANAVDKRPCPPAYEGYAQRRCSRQPTVPQDLNNEAEMPTISLVWETPDFSSCIPRTILELESNWSSITLGYSRNSIGDIVTQLYNYIEARLDVKNLTGAAESLDSEPSIFPGEGTSVLRLMNSMTTYFSRKSHTLDPLFWNATAMEFLKSLDGLLSMPEEFFGKGALSLMVILQNYVQLLNDFLPWPIASKLTNIDVDIRTANTTSREESAADVISVLSYKNFISPRPLYEDHATRLISAPVFCLPGAGFNFSAVRLSVALPAKGLLRNFTQHQPSAQFFCVLLPLRGATMQWDTKSCTLTDGNKSHVFCQCSQLGTVSLALRTEPSQSGGYQPKALMPLTIAAASSSLILITVLVSTMIGRWYYYKTCWAWLQVQLNLALLLSIAMFFTSTKIQVFLFSVFAQLYCSTLTAVGIYTRIKLTRKQSDNSLVQRPLCFHIPTLAVPLAVSGVHGLIEVFQGESCNQISLSHFAVIASSASMLLLIAMYLICCSLLQLRKLPCDNKEIEDRLIYSSAKRTRLARRCILVCCNITVAVILLVAMMIGQRWPSVNIKFCTATLLLIMSLFHCISSLILCEIPRARSIWLLCIRKCCCDGFRERLHETVLMESPTRTNRIDVTDSTNANSSGPSTYAQDSQDTLILEQVPQRPKRISRSGPASLPLLQRAGLGPDVQRAFAEQNPETQTQQLKYSITQTHVFIDHPSSQKAAEPFMDGGFDPKYDADSGLGPSGESRKTNILEKKLSLVLKAICHTKLRMTDKVFTVWSTNSFRSRHSTVSSFTTDHGGDRSISVTTTETEMHSASEGPSQLAVRRSRWSEDYGNQSDLSSSENSGPINVRPFRGRCYIRCSPEKRFRSWRSSRRTETTLTADVIHQPTTMTSPKSCERCWHNPEVPACDLCIASFNIGFESTRPVLIRACAVIEKQPAFMSSSEYLDMDTAGSLAVKEFLPDPSYYNVLQKNNGDDIMTDQIRSPLLSYSAPATPHLVSYKSRDSLRQRISVGKISRKNRLSLRSLVHSTLSLTYLSTGHKRLRDADHRNKPSVLTL